MSVLKPETTKCDLKRSGRHLEKNGNKSNGNNHSASAVGHGSVVLIVLLGGLGLSDGHGASDVGGRVGDVDGDLREGVGVLGDGSGLDSDPETLGTVGVESDNPGVVGSGGAGNQLRGLAVVNNVERARDPLELPGGSRVGQHQAVVGGSSEELAVSSNEVVIVGVEGRGGIVGGQGGDSHESRILDGQKRLGPGSHIVLRLGVKVDIRGGLVHLGENGSGSQSNGLEEEHD